TIKLWDLSQGQLLHSFAANDLIVYGVAFSPDGKQLLSSGDEMVKLWELPSARVLKTFAGNGGSLLGLALSQDGRRVAAGCSAVQDQHGLRPGEVRVWKLETGELAFSAAGEEPDDSTFRSV